MNQKMNEFREKLLCAGFHAADNEKFCCTHFWKSVTNKTAFVVNLKDLSTEISVLYGYVSTASWFSQDAFDFHKQRGIADDDVHLRQFLIIADQTDEMDAQKVIGDFYQKFYNADKDTILEVARTDREDFMNKVNDLLIVHDFRRRGKQHKWVKNLADGFILEFWIDRSSYSDLYYLQVDIFPKKKTGFHCYSNRLYAPDLKSENGCVVEKFDLRLQKDYVLYKVIDQCFIKQLLPLFCKPLSELGEDSMIWAGCTCPRQCCSHCWVEKKS